MNGETLVRQRRTTIFSIVTWAPVCQPDEVDAAQLGRDQVFGEASQITSLSHSFPTWWLKSKNRIISGMKRTDGTCRCCSHRD